jgi:alkanesulfonate monooxygenase SsuD/methylene tetrahydromethanopterin reductase-like flavin-dependent oxidoreductase (luciferase family)
MRFGVFDHMDRNGPDLGQQYRDRLQLIEAYDRAGFYAYHLAEHHGTPLGLASAPSVFLAAVSQRTKSLRFGPLVYTLSIYHPLRAIEEICMLDQLSGGRLELGIGRGISPIEMGFYGTGDDAQEIYQEVSEIILQGLASDRLNYTGKYYSFDDVPLELRPVQRPRPPLWYGVGRAETTPWAAANKMNIVTNGPASAVRKITDQFKAEWARSPHAAEALPRVGMSRHIVIGQTDKDAVESAAPAYAQWYASLLHLWRIHDIPIPLNFPEQFEEAQAAGLCIAGSAQTVRNALIPDIEESGVNYLLCRLAFGNLTMEESMQSVALMQHEIMPAFAMRVLEG